MIHIINQYLTYQKLPFWFATGKEIYIKESKDDDKKLEDCYEYEYNYLYLNSLQYRQWYNLKLPYPVFTYFLHEKQINWKSYLESCDYHYHNNEFLYMIIYKLESTELTFYNFYEKISHDRRAIRILNNKFKHHQDNSMTIPIDELTYEYLEEFIYNNPRYQTFYPKTIKRIFHKFIKNVDKFKYFLNYFNYDLSDVRLDSYLHIELDKTKYLLLKQYNFNFDENIRCFMRSTPLELLKTIKTTPFTTDDLVTYTSFIPNDLTFYETLNIQRGTYFENLFLYDLLRYCENPEIFEYFNVTSVPLDKLTEDNIINVMRIFPGTDIYADNERLYKENPRILSSYWLRMNYPPKLKETRQNPIILDKMLTLPDFEIDDLDISPDFIRVTLRDSSHHLVRCKLKNYRAKHHI